MKVGISILLFGVVLMFWTGASGEQNFFRKRNNAIDNQKVIFRFYLMPWLSRLKGTLVRPLLLCLNLLSRHYPNWTGQAENFRLEMRPSQGSPNLLVHQILSEYWVSGALVKFTVEKGDATSARTHLANCL